MRDTITFKSLISVIEISVFRIPMRDTITSSTSFISNLSGVFRIPMRDTILKSDALSLPRWSGF